MGVIPGPSSLRLQMTPGSGIRLPTRTFREYEYYVRMVWLWCQHVRVNRAYTV